MCFKDNLRPACATPESSEPEDMLTLWIENSRICLAMNENSRSEPRDDRSPEERKLRAAFGKRIGQLRRRRRWSQAELARRLEVERTTVLRWESGSLPPVRMLILLSDVLDTTLDALLAGRKISGDVSLTEDQKEAAAQHLNQLAGLLRLRPRGSRD